MAKQENRAPGQGKVNGIERWLDGVYKNAPALPTGARDWIANNSYWLAAVGGILGLWGAYSLWQLARWGSNLAQYTNEGSLYYGTAFSPLIWLVLAVVVVQAVIMLLAVGPLKAHRKSGWNLLFYSALLSVVTAVLYLIMDGYGIGNAISSLIGCAVALYFLFQVRSHFTKA
jgi:hypothetical protein